MFHFGPCSGTFAQRGGFMAVAGILMDIVFYGGGRSFLVFVISFRSPTESVRRLFLFETGIGICFCDEAEL